MSDATHEKASHPSCIYSCLRQLQSPFFLAPAAFAGSITNGSFEVVQIGSPFFSGNPADIPGWTHTRSSGDALLWAVGYSDSNGSITTAGAGNQFVTMGGGFDGLGSAAW